MAGKHKPYYVVVRSTGVTHRDFCTVWKLMGWDMETLCEEQRGINAPEETTHTYFTRIKQGGDTVIPFKAFTDRYLKTVAFLIKAGKLKGCECGCGTPMFRQRQAEAEPPVIWDSAPWSGIDYLRPNG
jgi:hypothetical protein